MANINLVKKLQEKRDEMRSKREMFDVIDVDFRNDVLSIFMYNEDGKGGSKEIHVSGRDTALSLANAIIQEVNSVDVDVVDSEEDTTTE